MRKFAGALLVTFLAAACGGPDGTSGDQTPPAIVDRVPAPGATDVELVEVRLVFDEEIDAASASRESVLVFHVADELPISGDVHVIDGTDVAFFPDGDIVPESEIGVSVMGLRDQSGNVIEPTAWTFTVR